MPFTFSHPAAVLPFGNIKKIPVSLTGLVIGSMVPDFEFLFLLRESDYIGHLWPGIILFNLPAAVLASFIFHYLVRNSLIMHLPEFLQQRFAGVISFDWLSYFKKHYLLFFMSVILGVGSHVFADAFTHQDGFMAKPAFFHYQLNLAFATIPVYFFLQLLTSLAGALYIFWYVMKMPKEKSQQFNCRPVRYWVLFFIAVPCILLVRFTITAHYRTTDDVIIAVTGSLLYALLFTSIVSHKQAVHT